MMGKKKELDLEDLEKVTGGTAGTDGIDTKGQFTDFINMYALHDSKYFGQEFYFVYKDKAGIWWYKAKLINSYEAWNWFGTTVCTHEVEVTESGNSGNRVGRKFKPGGDEVACYKTKNF